MPLLATSRVSFQSFTAQRVVSVSQRVGKQAVSSAQGSKPDDFVDVAKDADLTARPSLIRLAAIVLWILQVLTMTLMLPLAVWQLETILGSGLVLTVIGLLLAVVAAPLRSWAVLSFALSAPLICMVGARSIAHFQWNPSEASRPIPIILGVLSILTLPLAVMAHIRILNSHTAHWLRISFPWRYSLKSLLIITTVTCLIVAGVRAILVSAGSEDYFGFDLFNLAAATLTAGTVYLFIAHRRSV